tara:strand:- start:608 stop:1231 length:624 start_codon:yes stop_codon:yes gene_type:complete
MGVNIPENERGVITWEEVGSCCCSDPPPNPNWQCNCGLTFPDGCGENTIASSSGELPWNSPFSMGGEIWGYDPLDPNDPVRNCANIPGNVFAKVSGPVNADIRPNTNAPIRSLFNSAGLLAWAFVSDNWDPNLEYDPNRPPEEECFNRYTSGFGEVRSRTIDDIIPPEDCNPVDGPFGGCGRYKLPSIKQSQVAYTSNCNILSVTPQ